MAKRDPEVSARNRMVASIKGELRELLPQVLDVVGLDTEAQLNAKIGSKHDKFFDLKHDVLSSQDQFVNLWLQGLKQSATNGYSGADRWIYQNLQQHECFRRYLVLFLNRSYLKHFTEWSKNRPRTEEAAIWIGQRNANWGLLITPRFRNGQWENDKSEIRAFPNIYWSIGHVLATGLVVPGQDQTMNFPNVNAYLDFFRNVIVRNSGSQYEYEIARLYSDFVLASPSPEDVPLLIPEFRYGGIATNHKYRLDFLIINSFTNTKIGFELSPWSSHGYLSKIGGLTQVEINEMAKDNFEREMKKHRDFFNTFGIFCLIFTDGMLADIEGLFNQQISPHLVLEDNRQTLSFRIMEEFLP